MGHKNNEMKQFRQRHALTLPLAGTHGHFPGLVTYYGANRDVFESN